LPKTIADLESEGRTLQKKLDDPEFFARDRTDFEKTTAALGAVQTKLAEAEERWLELEILREELGG
jgi:ATP-binding cassette subfamily F protein uup